MNATRTDTTKRPYTPRTPVEWTCQHCGASFMSSGYASKYCTTSCRESARYERDKEKRLASVQEYRKANRLEISARRKKARLDNPDHHARLARESYVRNREQRVADAVAYQKANPHVVALTRNRRRAAVRFTITLKDHRSLMAQYRGCCAYCGVKLTAWGRANPTSLQWDHIIPLSRGGWDSIGNLAPACRDCNRSKSAMFLVEWRARSQ